MPSWGFISNMKRLWRTLEVLAWGTFFALAVAVLGLRYGVLPQVERYRAEIVAGVSSTVGLPVKIGRIEAEWNGLRPQLNLSDVRIYDAEGREALTLPSVENILSWRSLAHGELHLHAPSPWRGPTAWITPLSRSMPPTRCSRWCPRNGARP